jgi:hypothetical protein
MMEMVEKRTRNSKTYSLGQNRYSCDVSIGAIHYKDNPTDETEPWQDIDTTISVDGKVRKAPYDLDIYLTGMPGFHYRSKESGEFDIRLKAARLPLAGGDISPVLPEPIISSNQAIWENIYPDTNVVLVATNTGVILKRVLKSDKAPTEYDVDIQEVKSGVAKLMPLKPAKDANGQDLVMEETNRAEGRCERLKFEVIPMLGEKPKPIAYPIEDATEVDEQVGASADDGYGVYWDGGAFYNDTTPLKAGTYDGDEFDSFFRFSSVTIPNGATIGTSYVQCKAEYDGLGSPELKLDFEDNSDPSAPSDKDDLAGRTRTGQGVDWDSVWTEENWEQSPSLTDLIQWLVNKYDYSNGKAMLALLDNDRAATGTHRNWAYSYEAGDHTRGAKLHIEYTAGVTVAPNPASAIGAVVAPTVILGSLTIIPGIVHALAQVVAPTVVLGSISITPSDSSVIALTIDPTVQVGGVVVTPTPCGAVVASVAPGIVLGSITITPAAVVAIVRSVAPFIEGEIQILFITPSMDTGLAIASKLSTGLSLTKIFKPALKITPTTKER